MAEILELAELAHDHRVADVDIGGGGIHAQLDAQGLIRGHALLELLEQVLLVDEIDDAALEDFELFTSRTHSCFSGVEVSQER